MQRLFEKISEGYPSFRQTMPARAFGAPCARFPHFLSQCSSASLLRPTRSSGLSIARIDGSILLSPSSFFKFVYGFNELRPVEGNAINPGNLGIRLLRHTAPAPHAAVLYGRGFAR
jgi:hypothetical protein